jgi:hypothetical protein
MQELRANTQVIVTVGPFVDVGDGFTPQTDIALSGNEAELIKHGSTTVVDISGATWAAVTNCRGYYSLTLTTSHTDTEGMLVVIVQDDSDCLPVKQEYMVLSEAAYDSKYVAKDDGFMDVNIKTVGRADTQETEANNLESACANYSATRGLTGTAVPAAAAGAAGGIPLSTAGSLEMDTLADWVNAGRLDAILDTIAGDVVNLDGEAMRGTNNAALASVCTETRLAELAAANIPADIDTLLARITAAVALASVCTEARLSELDAATAGKAANQIDEIRADTEDLQTQIGTAGAGLGDLGGMSTAMKAEIETEVNDALDTAISELGVAAPTATPTIRTALMLMYMALRNKLVVQTSGTDAIEVYNDAGTKIAAKAITDDGSDYTEAEMA